MDMVVCVVWSLLLLMHAPRYKAESPALVSLSATVSENDALDPFVTSKMTDPEEPITMDLFRLPSARQHISRAQSPSDITPFLIPPRSTTITPGSLIPSSTNLDKVHQNSSQSTSSEMIPTEYLNPSSSPPSTLENLITGSAFLGKEEDQNEPSELDVGDEDSVPSPSPLDPLLAGLISIFIISTAMLFIILFLKFRQHGSHPEFHRLQDLPMDDLLEDTPLSRYSY